MRKYAILSAIVLAGLLSGFVVIEPGCAADQPPETASATSSGQEAGGNGDPFAGMFDDQPIEVIKTGPTCQFIRIQLPPGVTFEDIQGLPTP